jgi:hypothetical protein
MTYSLNYSSSRETASLPTERSKAASEAIPEEEEEAIEDAI